LRAKLRARLPGLFEIVCVYEGQNALVIAHSRTEHGAAGVCAIAAHPHGEKLNFGRGARLSKSDPSELLQSRGKTVRAIVMNTAADFDRAEIEVLMAAALKLATLSLDPGAKDSAIFKAEEQPQLARRAAKRAKSAASNPAASTWR
jgi:hypothetical protein